MGIVHNNLQNLGLIKDSRSMLKLWKYRFLIWNHDTKWEGFYEVIRDDKCYNVHEALVFYIAKNWENASRKKDERKNVVGSKNI